MDGRLDFPESTYEQMLVSFQVGVDHSTNALLPGYLVTEDAAERIVKWAAETSGYFEAVAQICATNLELGTSLPQPLRTFASQVLRGQFRQPKIRHRPRNRDWMEKAFLYSWGFSAHLNFDLTLTRNDVTESRRNACDALSEALGVCGCPRSYSQIKRLFVHKDYARFREENSRVGQAWQKKQSVKQVIQNLLE